MKQTVLFLCLIAVLFGQAAFGAVTKMTNETRLGLLVFVRNHKKLQYQRIAFCLEYGSAKLDFCWTGNAFFVLRLRKLGYRKTDDYPIFTPCC